MDLTHPDPRDQAAASDAGQLGEFDVVRLLEDIPAGTGVMWLYDDETAESLVAGSTGTIVHDLGKDGRFLVEFSEPVAALTEVTKGQIARL